jgi:hypothetical protein
MRVRCVAWLLVLTIVSVSLDSLPDPPALQSHPGDSQIILSLHKQAHATKNHTLLLDSYTHVSRHNVSWIPIRQQFHGNGSISPLTPAHHSSDSSPPVSSHS